MSDKTPMELATERLNKADAAVKEHKALLEMLAEQVTEAKAALAEHKSEFRAARAELNALLVKPRAKKEPANG